MRKFVTLTGVDASTDLQAVRALAREYPWAEFGILLSRTRPAEGERRYPPAAEIPDMVDDIGPHANLALHICGKAVMEFVTGNSEIHDIARRFGRVQLNFTADRIRFSIGQLDQAIAAFGPKPVITQHNQANISVSSSITAPNHQVLFDASGGRGVRADGGWPSPIDGKICGYAGGIGPQTVVSDLERAARAAGGAEHWIDMESSLRTADDRFDLDIVREVLRRVASEALAPALSTSQRFLLGWLSKEESSALGECEGSDLDVLVSKGLASIKQAPAKRGRQYGCVSLTEAGYTLNSRITAQAAPTQSL